MDTHLHSNFSDGKNSIEEMTRVAVKIGLKKIAFTDHVRRDTEYIDKFLKEIKRTQKKYPEIKIFSGIEAKVIDMEGNIDAKESFFKKVGLVLAAFHRIPKGEEIYFSKQEILRNKPIVFDFWYQAFLKVLENKNVDIIAHPCLILKRNEINLPKENKEIIAKKAKEYKKIFEINIMHKVPDKEFVKILQKNNVILTYGSDSHSVEDLINCYK